MFDVPIAFFVFRRPELTKRVFEQISRIQPRMLLLIADGPRSKSEEAICQQVRKIVTQIPWQCEVLTCFSEANLGCKMRISSGLDWVFSMVESAIILEDDTLPSLTFFDFCRNSLARYKDDPRIMHISGDTFITPQTEFSSYISKYPHNWGWATWRRAWKHYDVQMGAWSSRRAHILEICGSEAERTYWARQFDLTSQGLIDTWDFQWVCTCWDQRGFSILPSRNLVSNIGFGSDSTHTFTNSSPLANLPVADLTEIQHPATFVYNPDLDQQIFESVFHQGQAAASRTKGNCSRRTPVKPDAQRQKSVFFFSGLLARLRSRGRQEG
jgi:hypothetical protein